MEKKGGENMQLILSFRHFEGSDPLRRHVEEEFGALDKYEPRISRIEVTLLEEKDRRDVEVLCSVDGGGTLHAEAQAGDFRTAVDQARDRLARQLKKIRSRHKDHQAPRDELPGAPDQDLP